MKVLALTIHRAGICYKCVVEHVGTKNSRTKELLKSFVEFILIIQFDLGRHTQEKKVTLLTKTKSMCSPLNNLTNQLKLDKKNV